MIGIGNDHGGFGLKKNLLDALKAWNVEFEDLGCYDSSSVDYPDIAHKVAAGVANGTFERGVLICGTGLGMSYAANRHPGVRAALCTDPYMATMSRAHNDANLLCLGARVIGPGLAEAILKAFLDGSFEGGRHARRVDAIELKG